MNEAKGRYDELFAWYKPEENPDAPNWMKVVYNRVKELEQQNKEMRELLESITEYRIFFKESLDQDTQLEQQIKEFTEATK